MPFLAPAALRALAAAGFTRSRPCRRVRSMLSGWFKASSNYMTAGDTLSRFADRLNGSSQMSARQTLRAPKGRTCPHLKRIRNTRMSEPRAHPTPRVPELRVHLSLARVRTLRAPYIARARIVHAPESHPHPKPGSSFARSSKRQPLQSGQSALRRLLLSPQDWPAKFCTGLCTDSVKGCEVLVKSTNPSQRTATLRLHCSNRA